MIESVNKPAVLPAMAEQQKPLKSPVGLEPWLLCSATLSAIGWILSAFGQLNARGYAIALIVALGAFLFWRSGRIVQDLKEVRIGRLVRRFRKPLPFGFLMLACLSLIGGLIYLPTNYDALAYRVPRVLHWLAHGHWHWVHTAFNRLNVRACGYEWLMAPLLALTGSTRLLFLPSIISFLLLPGLFFSVFK
ncbi:MAG TPA: hypothetical protein VFB72_04585, partial [Verrucomicrobiae bacterium]|nr:hypothetical protein [Verrucomicrobiae bacterium]